MRRKSAVILIAGAACLLALPNVILAENAEAGRDAQGDREKAYREEGTPEKTSGMIRLPGGEYRPLISDSSTPKTLVKPFRLDATPVTNRDFARFVAGHPQWSPHNILPMFAEPRYLQSWREAASITPQQIEDPQKPVVNVSWFAARAYCAAQGKRLPTTAEWEFAGRASATKVDASRDTDFVQHILAWYAQPASATLPAVMQSRPNYWGVYDMHGVIWEWTQDFNRTEVPRDQQSNLLTLLINGRQVPVDVGAFCGAGAAGVSNPSDYAAFMRYSFRRSLKATFVLDTLGFRCAADDGA